MFYRLRLRSGYTIQPVTDSTFSEAPYPACRVGGSTQALGSACGRHPDQPPDVRAFAGRMSPPTTIIWNAANVSASSTMSATSIAPCARSSAETTAGSSASPPVWGQKTALGGAIGCAAGLDRLIHRGRC
jgi:hypothetical protein